MAEPQITTAQKKIIWTIARMRLGMGKDEVYALLFDMFEAERMSALTSAQGDVVIRTLRRLEERYGPGRASGPQVAKIMAMARGFGWGMRGLREWLRRTTGVEDPRWMTVRQARDAIAGLERILAWNRGKEGADGV